MANKPKQKTTQTTYLFYNYIVTIENIRNTNSGQPRHRAYITNRPNLEQWGSSGACVYEFIGHYMGERAEALWILKQHLFKYYSDGKDFNELYKLYDNLK